MACALLFVGSWPVAASAAELQVRLTDGRTLRGSFVEKQSNAEQLAIEVRSAGSLIFRTLLWKQVTSVKVLPSQESYEPVSSIRGDVQINATTSSNAEDSNAEKMSRLPLFELIV